MRHKQILSANRGQSLLEVIVVVAVVVTLISGLLVGTTYTLRTGAFAKVKGQSVKAAQEGIELARQLRDEGWQAFVDSQGSWCLSEDGAWTALSGSCPINIGTRLTRLVELTWNAVDQRMEALVTVSWQEGTTTYQSQLESYFTQWK